MSITKIPTPDTPGVVSGILRFALVVGVDRGAVLYQYDEEDPSGRVYVRVSDGRVSIHSLLSPVGRVAVSLELGCGERVDPETVELGEPADQAIALRGIPYLYAALHGTAERRALRALYHRLATAPAAAAA
jgi:hypothetical protein